MAGTGTPLGSVVLVVLVVTSSVTGVRFGLRELLRREADGDRLGVAVGCHEHGGRGRGDRKRRDDRAGQDEGRDVCAFGLDSSFRIDQGASRFL